MRIAFWTWVWEELEGRRGAGRKGKGQKRTLGL